MTDKTETTASTHELPPTRARSVSELKSDPPGPEPPDSGWSWVVLLGTFVVTINSIGFVVAMSVFFLPWKNEFSTSAAATSVVISMGSFMRGFTSPIVGILFTKFSPRTVMMFGGLISSVGIILASLATSITFLICTAGVLSAIGFSMSFNANFVMLGRYFKKRYSMAVSLTMAGVSAGQLAFPPLYTWLITEYGWRGSMFIIAGINMNTIAAGALMRPVRDKKDSRKKKQCQENTAAVSTSPKCEQSSNETDIPSIDINSHVENNKDHLDDVRNDVQTSDKIALVVDDFVDDLSETDEDEMNEDYSNLDEFPKIQNSPGDPFIFTITEDHISRISAVIYKKPDSLFGYIKVFFQRVKTFLLETYGLKRLSRNLPFLILTFMAFSHAFGWASMSVHLVARAESVGIANEESSLFLSIMGGFGIMTRVLSGWVIDKDYITAEILYSISMFIYALCTSVIPVFTTFVPLAALSVALGLSSGSSGSLVLVVLRKLIRLPEAVGATGILFLCFGIGEVSGAAIAGFLYDANGIYDFSFYCSGAATLIAGILALPIYFLLKAKKRRHLAKKTVAISVENPGFVAGENMSNGDSILETAVESNVGDHEAVNPLYSITKAKVTNEMIGGQSSAAHGKFNLPMKKYWVSKWGHKQEHRFQMSNITQMEIPGNPSDEDFEKKLHGDNMVANNATNFENPTFSAEDNRSFEDWSQCSDDEEERKENQENNMPGKLSAKIPLKTSEDLSPSSDDEGSLRGNQVRDENKEAVRLSPEMIDGIENPAFLEENESAERSADDCSDIEPVD